MSCDLYLDTLGKILSYLLDNAIKFSHKGRQVSIKVDVQDMYLKFNVIDQGIGISAQNIKTIFEPFTQENDSFTRGNEGMGVGLSICKKLLENMNGSISIESVEQLGSSFNLSIPLN